MMNEKKIQNYNKQKELFEQSQRRRETNIQKQVDDVKAKKQRLEEHLDQLATDIEKLFQKEFPPIEEFYNISSKQSNENQVSADSPKQESKFQELSFRTEFDDIKNVQTD